MRRRLFTLAAALSLLLCVAMAAGWASSYSQAFPPTGAEWRVIPFPVPSDCAVYLVLADGRIQQWEYAPWNRTWYVYSEGAPIWLPMLLTLVAPSWWIVQRRIE